MFLYNLFFQAKHRLQTVSKSLTGNMHEQLDKAMLLPRSSFTIKRETFKSNKHYKLLRLVPLLAATLLGNIFSGSGVPWWPGSNPRPCH